MKHVKYLTKHGKIRSSILQVGDKITKPLLAVSQECAAGNAVFFGPGPEFESYVIHDPKARVIHNGEVTKIMLNNGVYEMHVRA